MSFKGRNVGIYSEIDVTKQIIDKANSANLSSIFYEFDVRVSHQDRKTQCPFPSHKNGAEKSGSFIFYPDTNSFYCFGCKNGGGPVEFVSIYENINKYSAAIMITSNFATGEVRTIERQDNHYKFYLDFSHLVREFILKNARNPKAVAYAEEACAAFDTVRFKYSLDEQAVSKLFFKLKSRLETFDDSNTSIGRCPPR